MRAKVFGSFFSHIGDVRTTGKSGSYRIKIITTVPPAVSDVYRIKYIFLKRGNFVLNHLYHVNQVPYFLIKQMTLKSEPSLSYA